MLSKKRTVVFSHKFNAEIEESRLFSRIYWAQTELANQIEHLLYILYIMFMYTYGCTILQMLDSSDTVGADVGEKKIKNKIKTPSKWE